MQKALRFVGILFLVLALLAGGTGAYLWTQRDAILQGGISKINEQLNAPVAVSTVELDLFSGFPRVRIALSDVRIDDISGNYPHLLQAQRVGLGMNILEVIKGTYRIEELALERGSLHLFSDGRTENWSLFKESETESAPVDLQRVVLQDIDLTYRDSHAKDTYAANVKNALISGQIAARSTYELTADLQQASAVFEGEHMFEQADIQGSVSIVIDENLWSVQSSKTIFNGSAFSYSLSPEHTEVRANQLDVVALSRSVSAIDFGDLEMRKLRGDFTWESTGEQQHAVFNPSAVAFIYNGFQVLDYQGVVDIHWGQEKSVSAPNMFVKTATGDLRGNIQITGKRPKLEALLSGGSNLSELFQFVEVETLSNPMGFWKGTDLKIGQSFFSWEDFSPVGETAFEGAFSILDGSFGLSESTIAFEKIEADLKVQAEGNVVVERCFLQSGTNNATVSGTIYDALTGGRPQVKLLVESPAIDVDPLLFWEFDDDGESDEDYGFDFEIDLAIATVNMGDFDGTKLRGIVYNKGVKLLGREMFIKGCGGSFSGNWALAEENGGGRFWSIARADGIEMDQLLKSFDSFDIEDLDESNLSGTATLQGEMTFHFDPDWNVISKATVIDGQGTLVDGELRNYAPLEELGAFIDQNELQNIRFPKIAGSFGVRGDTLVLPETFVENSAINFWVNGWQNLETDDLSYSMRLGLKDLALRGKNSNRDLGNWVSEAENESQPYVRLLIGCNLEDVCISLDRKRITTQLKETLKQEREDLKNLFKPRKTEEKDAGQGSFELLWPETTDSLKVQSLR